MRAPCSIDGCERQSAGRGWCSTHWLRWRKHGDPMIVLPKVGHPRKYPEVCQVDGCEAGHHAHGYCSKHANALAKYGDPLGKGGPITGRPPRGGVPGYAAAHKRVRRALGAPSEHQCIQCQGPAAEWAYQGGDPDELTTDPAIRKQEHPGLAYSLSADYYKPMCVRCHRAMDGSLLALLVHGVEYRYG